MKLISFIGTFDKTDLMLNVAKILTVAKTKVLMIDGTTIQKARYVVPVINPTKSYITTFQDIDVAVGFSNIDDIKRYLSLASNETFEYDYVLVDCDNIEKFESFRLSDSLINYFVTSFGPYPLKRGLEMLSELKSPIRVKKILFSRYMSVEEEQYLSFLATGINVEWQKEKIYFPFQEGDVHVNLENQISEKIKLKDLSEEYKEGLMGICQDILENIVSASEIKKIVKSLERG